MEAVVVVILLGLVWLIVRWNRRAGERAETITYDFRTDPGPRNTTRKSDAPFDPGPVLRDGMNEDWRIEYVDRDDVQTTRTITVLSLHGEKYPKYIFAFCHLRQDHRHFNVYNIVTVTDAAGHAVPVTRHLLDWLHQRDLGTIGGGGEGNRVEHELAEPVPVVIRNDRTGETWDMQISVFMVRYGTPLIRGRATRRKTKHHGKWTGQKTFGRDPEDIICDPDTSDTWRDPRTHPDIARQIQD